MSKRRGKRVVVGYVVSHTGKRGGPWEAPFGHGIGTATRKLHTAFRTCDKSHAEVVAYVVAAKHPQARALPLVRYELDAEEERLRDAVVEAAERHADAIERAVSLLRDAEVGDQKAVSACRREREASSAMRTAVRALRAHRGKVRRG